MAGAHNGQTVRWHLLVKLWKATGLCRRICRRIGRSVFDLACVASRIHPAIRGAFAAWWHVTGEVMGNNGKKVKREDPVLEPQRRWPFMSPSGSRRRARRSERFNGLVPDFSGRIALDAFLWCSQE